MTRDDSLDGWAMATLLLVSLALGFVGALDLRSAAFVGVPALACGVVWLLRRWRSE